MRNSEAHVVFVSDCTVFFTHHPFRHALLLPSVHDICWRWARYQAVARWKEGDSIA